MAAVVHLEHRPPGSVMALPTPPRPARARRPHDGLVLGLLALILLAGVALRLGAPPGEGAPPSGGAPVHVVEPGDTYWSIAAAQAPGGDLRAAVDRLVESNGWRTLQPGDWITLAPLRR